jgi:hypothetical protein
MSMPAAPDIYAVMEMRGHCTIPDIVEPMNKFANMHDRFRRRVVYGFGAWHAEVLDDFDVTLMMREVTLPGSDAQQAFNTFTSQVRNRLTKSVWSPSSHVRFASQHPILAGAEVVAGRQSACHAS